MKGEKLDYEKLPIDIVLTQFPRALEAVAKCSQYGHKKYEEYDKDWQNWSRVPNARFRYSQATMRHRLERAKGEEVDLESKLDHEFHQLWNSLAALEVKLRENVK